MTIHWNIIHPESTTRCLNVHNMLQYVNVDQVEVVESDGLDSDLALEVKLAMRKGHPLKIKLKHQSKCTYLIFVGSASDSKAH